MNLYRLVIELNLMEMEILYLKKYFFIRLGFFCYFMLYFNREECVFFGLFRLIIIKNKKLKVINF